MAILDFLIFLKMKSKDLIRLIREDNKRYEELEGKKSNLLKVIGRIFFSESFSITYWFRVCSYLSSKRTYIARFILKPLAFVYRMNEHHLGIELPIGTSVYGGGKILSLWNNRYQ